MFVQKASLYSTTKNLYVVFLIHSQTRLPTVSKYISQNTTSATPSRKGHPDFRHNSGRESHRIEGGWCHPGRPHAYRAQHGRRRKKGLQGIGGYNHISASNMLLVSFTNNQSELLLVCVFATIFSMFSSLFVHPSIDHNLVIDMISIKDALRRHFPSGQHLYRHLVGRAYQGRYRVLHSRWSTGCEQRVFQSRGDCPEGRLGRGPSHLSRHNSILANSRVGARAMGRGRAPRRGRQMRTHEQGT